jgi:hypothetical protein
VPYQSLLKVFLAERVDRETHGVNAPSTSSPPSRKRRRRATKPPTGRARSRG